MATLGTLEYLISVNTSKVNSGLNAAEGKFKGFGNRLSSWAVAKGQVLGRLIEKAGQATVSFVKGSVQESMAFDKSMAQVAATLGKSTSQVKDLAKFAREMGSKTAFTATQAAEALNYMALAGYDSEKSMRMLPQVLNLAAAGNMDLARASDMVTDAQSALGLSIEETEEMVDRMARTSSITNTSVEQLGDAILTVGGTAKSLKGGTTELSAVLGVLADNGIKGSEGGTALRNVLLSLTAPTDKAAKELKKLGIEVFDAEGNMRNVPEMLQDINEATADMTQQERTDFLSKVFNKRDLKAIEALLGTDMRRWEVLYNEIGQAEGSAEKMAETQLDNLAGDMTKFSSALGEAKLALVEGLTPSLRKLVQKGTTWVSRLTKAFSKDGFSGALREAGTIMQEGITYLKNSDSPILQKLGGALEKVRDAGKFVYTLFTDFPSAIAELKNSDSPVLNLVASALETIKTFVEAIEIAFNDGIPTAIQHLKEADDPLSNLLAGGLQLLYDVCKFFLDNLGLEGTITAIAGAFALFKTIEITGSFLSFLTKLNNIKNVSQLKELIGLVKNGDLPTTTPTIPPTTNTPPTTSDPTTTVAKGSLFARAAAFIKSKAALASAGGGLAPFAFLGAEGLLGYAGWKMIEANLKDPESNKIYGTGSKEGNSVVESMSDEAARAAKEYWAVYEDTGSEAAKDAREKLFKILEGEGYDYTERAVDYLETIFENMLNEHDPDEMQERLMKRFNELDPDMSPLEEKLKLKPLIKDVELEPPPKADEEIVKQVPTPHIPCVLVPEPLGFGNAGGAGGGGVNMTMLKAKGDWNVPYDTYAMLHRGETVLTASQARRYRNGEIGDSSAIVSAIQSLKNDMQNLKIVVGKKTFGRTVVDYGGDRVGDYINNSDSRLAAGYGT